MITLLILLLPILIILIGSMPWLFVSAEYIKFEYGKDTLITRLKEYKWHVWWYIKTNCATAVITYGMIIPVIFAIAYIWLNETFNECPSDCIYATYKPITQYKKHIDGSFYEHITYVKDGSCGHHHQKALHACGYYMIKWPFGELEK